MRGKIGVHLSCLYEKPVETRRDRLDRRYAPRNDDPFFSCLTTETRRAWRCTQRFPVFLCVLHASVVNLIEMNQVVVAKFPGTSKCADKVLMSRAFLHFL